MPYRKKDYWDNYYIGKDTRSIDKNDGWLEKYRHLFHCDSSVLDLGCGAGSNIDALLKMCKKVSAADFSAPALDLLVQKYTLGTISTHCFDMRDKFPFPDVYFDVVIADLAIHYFNSLETQHILSEIKRILTPHGTLLARVHSIKNIPQLHTPTAETGLVIANGYQRKYFTLIEIENFLTEWDIQVLEENSIYRFEKVKEIIEFAAVKR
ncbi:MAG: class I SAM-dependent methyltransferase [Oscillospiraceae bacterium]|nr:class I SAM-dependent methyltransferase [Oscillospiraceae bacterium]